MSSTTSYTYRSRIEWKRRPEDDGGAPGSYHRDHKVVVTERKTLDMSSAPEYKGDPDLLNPEELFVSAVSSCQMLTYLSLADRAGIRIVSYTDEAIGTLETSEHPASGRKVLRMSRVVLRPRIEIASGGDAAKARELVDKAHRYCFIANSVNSELATEAEVEVV